jgi:hypothetical protein
MRYAGYVTPSFSQGASMFLGGRDGRRVLRESDPSDRETGRPGDRARLEGRDAWDGLMEKKQNKEACVQPDKDCPEEEADGQSEALNNGAP